MTLKLLKFIAPTIFLFAFTSSIQAEYSEVIVFNNTKDYNVSGEVDVYQLNADIDSKPWIRPLNYGKPIKPGETEGYAAPVDNWIGWEGETRVVNTKYSNLKLTIWKKDASKDSGTTKTITLDRSNSSIPLINNDSVSAKLEVKNKRRTKVGNQHFAYYDYFITIEIPQSEKK